MSINIRQARAMMAIQATKSMKQWCAEYQQQQASGLGRLYRGIMNDGQMPASARFAGIYNRSSYQARRGR